MENFKVGENCILSPYICVCVGGADIKESIYFIIFLLSLPSSLCFFFCCNIFV